MRRRLDASAVARTARARPQRRRAGRGRRGARLGGGRLTAERIAADGEAVLLDPEGLPAELLRRLVLLCLRPDRGRRGAPRRSGDGAGRGLARRRRGDARPQAACRGGRRFRFAPAPPRRHG